MVMAAAAGAAAAASAAGVVAACSVAAGAAASAAGAAVSAGLEQAAMARVRASGSSSLRVALISGTLRIVGWEHSAAMARQGGRARNRYSDLRDARRFVEGQTRQTGEQARIVTVPQVDQEIRLDAGAGEEGFVDLGVVEAGHRAGIQAQRACGQDQVGALQAAVAERAFMAAFARAVEPALGVGVREQVRQLLVEVLVEGHDDGDRGSQGLVVV